MIETQKLDGSLLAARYAFMPNKLRYCGGDKNSELFGYITEQGKSDPGLEGLLKEFQTMYPYLRLIADSNKIFNPFDYKVVEAYWIGNELLENVNMQNFYRYLVDEQKLKKKFKLKSLERVFGKISAGAKPHHSWHVFSIPKRTGYYPVEHTIETMDDCIVSPARIKRLHTEPCKEDKKNKSSCGLLRKIVVEYQPLVANGSKLDLGEITEKEVFCEFNDKTLVKNPKKGDWVTLHWGWVCDLLSESQVSNLKKWTKYNLSLANL